MLCNMGITIYHVDAGPGLLGNIDGSGRYRSAADTQDPVCSGNVGQGDLPPRQTAIEGGIQPGREQPPGH